MSLSLESSDADNQIYSPWKSPQHANSLSKNGQKRSRIDPWGLANLHVSSQNCDDFAKNDTSSSRLDERGLADLLVPGDI